MKLLVISHSIVAPVNQQLFAELENQTSWQITLVCPSNWRDEYGRAVVPKRLEKFKGELISLPVWKSGSIILHAYRASLGHLMRRVNPDAIYVHHEPYAVATAQAYLANAMNLKRPIGFYSAQNIKKRYPPPFCWTERLVYRQSSFSFPVTADVEAVMRAKGYRGPATILPLGFDPETYFPATNRAEIRCKFDAAPDQVVLGYVGRIVQSKGLTTLARALAKIRELDWRLVIVGSGDFEQAFDRLAADLDLGGRVTRIGFVPHEQVPQYYSAFDVVVVPSETQKNWREQFGRVIVESLACGTPIVGSDSGEIPNLIRLTEGGLVFAERQPDELAAQLRKLITDATLRRRLSEAGRRAVLARFTNSALARTFVPTVLTVASDNSPPGHGAFTTAGGRLSAGTSRT